jgi:tRNA (guanine37-N1)-methyltransferase
MKIDILTLFPEMFKGPFATSMLKKAQDNGLVEINIHNLRKWSKDKHKTVDDRPYGGGKGMVIRVDIIDSALKNLKTEKRKNKTIITNHKSHIIQLSPQGKVFDQQTAKHLSKFNHIILIAGHYEGVDERVAEHLVDEEISIGDYVLTGGEIPSMVIVDSVIRLLPGVLEKEAVEHESFSLSTVHNPQNTLLDYPSYTRPEKFRGWKVPEILLSGNHAQIEKWRKKKAEEKTKKIRPDLLED